MSAFDKAWVDFVVVTSKSPRVICNPPLRAENNNSRAFRVGDPPGKPQRPFSAAGGALVIRGRGQEREQKALGIPDLGLVSPAAALEGPRQRGGTARGSPDSVLPPGVHSLFRGPELLPTPAGRGALGTSHRGQSSEKGQERRWSGAPWTSEVLGRPFRQSWGARKRFRPRHRQLQKRSAARTPDFLPSSAAGPARLQRKLVVGAQGPAVWSRGPERGPLRALGAGSEAESDAPGGREAAAAAWPPPAPPTWKPRKHPLQTFPRGFSRGGGWSVGKLSPFPEKGTGRDKVAADLPMDRRRNRLVRLGRRGRATAAYSASCASLATPLLPRWSPARQFFALGKNAGEKPNTAIEKSFPVRPPSFYKPREPSSAPTAPSQGKQAGVVPPGLPPTRNPTLRESQRSVANRTPLQPLEDNPHPSTPRGGATWVSVGGSLQAAAASVAQELSGGNEMGVNVCVHHQTVFRLPKDSWANTSPTQARPSPARPSPSAVPH
ncbi:hypothetical protein P7K49_011988 [Saguinus oedipus]|uniref:Uncharacterized protein n=1 Tax=Saguinus oedipus TaxID=9490 RepID=A0ABQ9VS71_SAGOE|nr:hypothetical protein P7K49_011988 [Saguinus oedipus]